jgi:hypothetical protein
MELANLTGPGTVDMIQLGLSGCTGGGNAGASVMLDSLLVIHIDEEAPLTTDLGTFFVAHCETGVWACDRLGVTYFTRWTDCGYFRRVMIPYNRHCVIELVNKSSVSSAIVFSQVYYYEGPTPGHLTGSRRHRFGWKWTPFTRVAPFRALDLLDITGRGVVDGIQLITAASGGNLPPRWLEGDPAFTIDGGAGNWHTGGTEDFFGTQFYGDQLHQTTDSWGMPTRKPIGGDQFCVTMYRFFDHDPVIFNNSCKFTFTNGQQLQGDGMSPPEVNVAALVSYYLAHGPQNVD